MASGKSIGLWLFAGAVALILFNQSSKDDEGNRMNVIADIRSDAAADGQADAIGDLEGTTFADIGDTSTCTVDCGGHNAGYQWAQDNSITDPAQCGGNSQSFIEGCEAYAGEVQRREMAAAEDAAKAAEDDDDLMEEYRP